jgi:hypothetical protein
MMPSRPIPGASDLGLITVQLLGRPSFLTCKMNPWLFPCVLEIKGYALAELWKLQTSCILPHKANPQKGFKHCTVPVLL